MKVMLKATIVLVLSLTSILYASVDNPVTREEFEQKMQEQQANIKELKALVAEQQKQILNFKLKNFNLKYGTDQNKADQSKDEMSENKKLQIIIENHKIEIAELRAKVKDEASKPQRITAKIVPAKAKGTKENKNRKLNVANGNKQITEVRKPARKFLENIDINKTGKGFPIYQKGIDEKNIRTGPGMKYENDATGALFEGEKLYVLDEKNGWICFRVTEKDLGWSAWIKKNLTDSFASSLEEVETKMKKAATSEYDGRIAELLNSGSIHSINIEYNEARLDPFLWVQLPLEQKQKLVMFLSKYFEVKGSTRRVTVFSNRNDTKLATFGSWGGLKILK